MSVVSRETEPIGGRQGCVFIYACIYRDVYLSYLSMERLIVKNWLMALWVLASLEFAGQVSRQKVLVRVDVAWSAGRIPQGIAVCFLVKPSPDWARPTHITEGNLLY